MSKTGQEIRRVLASLGIFINILSLAGCGKTIDCEIEGNHAHLYRSSQGIERYIPGEYDSIGSSNGRIYYKTDDYVEINDDNKAFYDYILKRKLISISDNERLLCEISDSLRDYYEFEYYYYTTEYTTHHYIDGDGNPQSYKTSETVRKTDWTTDMNHSNLTGNKEIMTHVFYGYKIVHNGSEYKLIKSGPVDDIRLLIEMGYDYIDSNIYYSKNRDSYLKAIGLYGTIDESELKPVYVIVDNEYVLYQEYILER